VDDDALVVSGGYMGSVKALDDMRFEDLVAGWESRFELLEALDVMERLLGRPVAHMVPFEVGGVNTPVVMSACARRGLPCVDGDALGRSAPETQMTSFIGHGIALTPMPLVDHYGNVVIVQGAREPAYADELGRWVVTHGGGMGANNHYPMSGRDLKRSVIPGTVSHALRLGRAIRAARQGGGDPVAAAIEVLGGTRLFTGAVAQVQGEDRGGFLHTRVRLEGRGPSRGAAAELVIMNEVMLATLDGHVRAIFPDLVCMLAPETGAGVTSVELEPGAELVLVGVPCHPRLRAALASQLGARALGPARYGYPELAYQPIETLEQAAPAMA
jgi:DUF917 family protein